MCYNLARKNEDKLFGQGTLLVEAWQNYNGLEDIKSSTEMFDTVIAGGIETANKAVSLITDGTGNGVQFEAIVMLGEDKSLDFHYCSYYDVLIA
ncbi:MAG: hypothetical protein ACOCMZ_01370 [Acetivibrio ethanolgignens]